MGRRKGKRGTRRRTKGKEGDEDAKRERGG